MPIKVLQLIPAFTTGGAELMAKRLALGYDPRRIRSDIWSLSAGSNMEMERMFLADLSGAGIRHGCFEKRPGLKDPITLLRLVQLIRREPYDIVHAHCDSPAFYARLAASLAGARKVVTIHLHMPPRSVRIERVMSRLTDLYVACSSETWRDLNAECRIPERKLVQILNGIGGDRTRNVAAARSEIRRRHGVRPDEQVALVLGRLSPQKAQTDVLQTLLHPGPLVRRLKIWIVGDDQVVPDYADKVRKFIDSNDLSSRVKVFGNVTDEELDELLKGADLFLLPSEREGLSVAILEALAAGLPTVISDLESNREATDDGRVAWLVRPHASEELAKTLEGILSDPASMKKRGEIAARFVQAKFGFERVIEEYSSACERLVLGDGN